MRIIDINLYEQNIPLKTPFKTALRTVNLLKSIIIEVITDNGFIGYGAAAPAAAVTGETIPSILCAIENYIKPVIIGKVVDISLTEKIVAAIAYNTTAKAAVESALYDLLAKEKNLPLFRYLGGKEEKTLKNDITISINTPEAMAKDAKKALDLGVETLKLKLGGHADEDIKRIDAVFDVDKKLVLRLDANQAWSYENAVKIIEHCRQKKYNIQFIEQPFAARETALMKKIKSAGISILADESVFNYFDAKRIAENNCADYINIKLAKSGGITEAVKIVDIAKKYGIGCLMGCMLESPIGVIVSAHFAAAFDNVIMYDLDAVELLEYNPIASDIEFTPDTIKVTDRCIGLGISDIGHTKRLT